MAATRSPVSVAVVRLIRMHGGPQPGMATEMRVRGKTPRKPHIGPRRHQGAGHTVTPTKKPISIRAV